MLKPNSFSALIFSALFLVACGGGGSGSDNKSADSASGSGDGSADSGGSNGDNSEDNANNANSTDTVYTPNLTLYGPFKTGKVVYKTTSTADFGALATIKGEGTERLVFKDWGNVSVEEVNKTTTTTSVKPDGSTTVDVETEHEMEKWITPKKYDVNFKNETITVLDFGVVYKGAADLIADSLTPTAVDNVNYVGKDTVIGYVCDVYQVGAVTMCMLNNVLLKAVTDLGSIKSTKTATSATFNTHILDDEFKIPTNFSIIKAN